MGTASVIGALKVVLGGDTTGLDKSLVESQAALSAFSSKVALGFAAVSAAALAAATSMASQVKAAIDSADHLNKLSQSSGVTTEELSRLTYAADLADVSGEALGKSMGKLSKALVAAGTDAASQAGRAFAAMGIDVKNQDGTLRSSAEVLKDLADRFAGYRDGAEKTALAIALFGKAGAAMIPLLNGGRDGLEEAASEADKFGLVLDKKTTMAAEAFNDNLRRMDLIKQGLVTTIAAKLLPNLEMLSEELLALKSDSEFTSTAADAITAAMKFLTGEVLSSVAAFKGLKAELTALWGVLNAPDWPSLKSAWENYIKVADQTRASLDAVGSVQDRIFSKKPEDNSTTWTMEGIAVRNLSREVMSYGEVWKSAAPIVGEAATATKNALDKFLDSQAKAVASQNAQADSIGKSIGMQAQLKVAYEADAIAKANNIVITDAFTARVTAAGDAAALAAMKVAGANATVQAMNPAQQFDVQMTQLQQLYDAGVISLETYGARQQQIAEAAQATWGQASASIAGSFATISSSFSKESSAMATAAKVFGVIQGTISMFTGAAKALELPFPANIAAVAAVLAKGASLVASIKSQTVPTGMMTGGSMMVRGGGGPDSVPVNMMASPGERIDIWRPEQGGGADPRGGGGGGGGGKVINVAVPIVTTREAVRDLFGLINDALGDGHRLNLVAN
ncbi:hypothetical protein [Bradyrhizobium sp. Bra78]|uniref:hypothetical protein n=1 Tax=Bradyrhizobium sp. Bra78 TaxID=2926010 RepID=UPI0021C73E9C|nr:hypothetical protein [Bradyrhizobium sp. Bra78]